MSEERLPGEELPDAEDDFEEPETGDDAEPGSEEPTEGDEPAEGEDAEPAARPEARRPGRRERQSAELRELRERLERQDRELASIRGQQQQPRRPDPAEQQRLDEQERANVRLLAHEDQINYWRNKDNQTFEQRLREQEIRTADRLDRSTWQQACRSDPVRARLSDRVEELFQQRMARGFPDTREDIFRYVYADEALKARDRQGGRQRREASARVRGQQTRPAGGRSDVQRNRQPVGDDYQQALQRIANKPLW